jgi:hypothetical protein
LPLALASGPDIYSVRALAQGSHGEHHHKKSIDDELEEFMKRALVSEVIRLKPKGRVTVAH